MNLCMHKMKVIFSHLVRLRMKIYAQKYEEYFIKIYSDTGILSEPQILENYRQEAIKRRKEIAEIIQSRLSCNPIL